MTTRQPEKGPSVTPDQETAAIEAAAMVIHTDGCAGPCDCTATGASHMLGEAEVDLARRIVAAVAPHLNGREESTEPPLPDGIFGRVELPGYRQHTGWITEETRFGVQMAVVRDWEGREMAAATIGPNSQVVYLPTPRKRPDPVAAIEGREDDGLWDTSSSDDPDEDPF